MYKKLLIGLLISSYSLAGQLDTLKEAIMQNKPVSGEQTWDNLHLLCKQRIGMFLMHDHPIREFILNRIPTPCTTPEELDSPVRSEIFNKTLGKVHTAAENRTARTWKA